MSCRTLALAVTRIARQSRGGAAASIASGSARWIIGLSGILAIAIGSAGCAAETDTDDVRVDPSSTLETRIFGGDRDKDAESGVVALRIGSGGTFELCSGALIAPNVVLTARHCVTRNLTTSVSCDQNGRSANGKHVASEEDPSAVGVYAGATPNFAQKPHAVTTKIVSRGGDYLCDSDIALLVLDHALEGAKPLPVRLGSSVGRGETIRSVGYGQNDRQEPLGTRFHKDGVAVLAMGKAVSASQTPLGPHEFEVGRSICQGDSGGPAISEETGAVVGVVSRGGGCDEDFGHIYTTTHGFESLFDQAFELAGGAPIVEPGGVRVRSAGGESFGGEEAHTAAASCSASPRSASSGGAAALVFAAAALCRRRRRA